MTTDAPARALASIVHQVAVLIRAGQDQSISMLAGAAACEEAATALTDALDRIRALEAALRAIAHLHKTGNLESVYLSDKMATIAYAALTPRQEPTP